MTSSVRKGPSVGRLVRMSVDPVYLHTGFVPYAEDEVPVYMERLLG